MIQQNSYTGMNPNYPNTVYGGPTYSNQPNVNQYQNWAAQNPYGQQQQLQPQPQPQPQQNQQIKSSRVWVQGESSAKAFIVANNTEQELWDAEQPVIYLKTVDAFGKPSMVILDYTIRNPKPDDQNETEALKAEISELKDMMKQLMTQKSNYKPNYKNNKGGEE